MPIHELTAENFKGIAERVTIPIKPLTLFIGPNSSGKSTCIHAIAALAQTVKLSNDPRALVLDDELAQVHLGRFIEVIHSKKYSDAISIGIGLGEIDFTEPGQIDDKGRFSLSKARGVGSALYDFKCTKRTQDVHLDRASFTVGPRHYAARRNDGEFDVTVQPSGVKARFGRDAGFLLDWQPAFTVPDPTALREMFALNDLQRALTEHLRQTLYLGPFRQAPQRRYPTRGASPTEVGAQGEATITMLANEIVQSRTRTHVRQIAEWLRLLGLGKDLDVNRVGSSDLFDVDITLNDDVTLPIADLGYGLSQVLPVLTQCSFAPVGATLLFEQPELHLHQLAAKPLAKVFIDTIRQRQAHVIAETHSPDLMMQIMAELRAGELDLSEVALFRVARHGGQTVLELLDVDPDTFDVYGAWDVDLTRRA
jgi:hypothetical protein